jgi:GNAT superfamily N-acetyltransferase
MTDESASSAASNGWSARRGDYAITTDRSALDLNLITDFVTHELVDSAGTTPDVVSRSIEHSLCFGVYEGLQQVGFARVVTDCATFAFICDDFVVESHRGRGLGTWLMECILSHPDLRGLRRVLLVTRDPRLYLKSGFRPLRDADTYMELSHPSPEPGAV